jgi:hypothetical protein
MVHDFETMARSYGLPLRRDNVSGEYVSVLTRGAYLGWAAAMRSIYRPPCERETFAASDRLALPAY